ncbi:MAG TPA: UDP-N-acetylglucosamine 2-epimerase [Saprospiraceae bacterium]|nr:UDP-N-acetylglucosamine 2-epimerase [Saprospiraceae bacterium]HUN17753.1 UDP-N-acetylglucosamine 2-epimerase [Saprospiraceae bacterium]
MKKICVVVTARPSYSRIKTALRAIDAHPELELQLVIAASALLERYGTAINYIEKDGFTVAAKVFNILEGENLTAQAKTTGLGILELSSVFERLNPDAVVTVADRFETMATAIAASYMNIPLVHIQGGEVTGNIDEKVRHAITKLADLHLVASEDARNRVIKMGENPEKVINTGCPSIDIAKEMISMSQLSFDPFQKYGGVGSMIDIHDGYLVVMQHPVTTEYSDSKKHVLETLHAIHQLNIPTFWFWPNVDAGADGTSKGMRSFREKHNPQNIHFFKNMEPTDFLELLYHSKCLIGNSSVGVRECAYLGVPVVNIGSRQGGRERGQNIIDVDYNKDEIKAAIHKQILHGRYDNDLIYGSGESGVMIADVLSKVEFTFDKKISY